MEENIISKIKDIKGRLGTLEYVVEAVFKSDKGVNEDSLNALHKVTESIMVGLVALQKEFVVGEDLDEEEAERVSKKLDDIFAKHSVTTVTLDGIKILEDGNEVDKEARIDEVKERMKNTEYSYNMEERLATQIVNDLDFSEEGEEYKNRFFDHLKGAIKTVNENYATCPFSVNANGGTLSGRISKVNGEVQVILGDKTHKEEDVAPNQQHEEEEVPEVRDQVECPYNPEDCHRHTCTCMEEGYLYPNNEATEALEDEILEADEEYRDNVNAILDGIEKELKNKRELDSKDIRLVRYFFKHQPYTTENVDKLSDRALELAWNFRKYRNNQ